MKVFNLLIFIAALSFFSCKDKSAPHPDNPNLYGAVLGEGEPVALAQLITMLEQSAEINNVKVKGRVESVCQAKGCWMNLMTDEQPARAVFVRFKDYDFFVPKDIAGMEVIMQGNAFIEETSVDELRHYAEDEGKSAEEIAAITQPVTEMKFTATGVEVLRP